MILGVIISDSHTLYNKKLLNIIAFYIVSTWGIETNLVLFSTNYLLLHNGLKTAFTVGLLVVMKWYVVKVDHVHFMSVRHT